MDNQTTVEMESVVKKLLPEFNTKLSPQGQYLTIFFTDMVPDGEDVRDHYPNIAVVQNCCKYSGYELGGGEMRLRLDEFHFPTAALESYIDKRKGE